MTIQLTKNSICEMMYMMRDAVEANNIPVAIFISRQINEKLLDMLQKQEDIDCNLQCEIKQGDNNEVE